MASATASRNADRREFPALEVGMVAPEAARPDIASVAGEKLSKTQSRTCPARQLGLGAVLLYGATRYNR